MVVIYPEKKRITEDTPDEEIKKLMDRFPAAANDLSKLLTNDSKKGTSKAKKAND